MGRVGKELSKSIKNDINNIRSSTDIKSIKDLNNHSSAHWLCNRPPELLHLLSNLCQIDINITSNKKLIILAKAVELICYCVYSRTVITKPFIRKLIVLFVN